MNNIYQRSGLLTHIALYILFTILNIGLQLSGVLSVGGLDVAFAPAVLWAGVLLIHFFLPGIMWQLGFFRDEATFTRNRRIFRNSDIHAGVVMGACLLTGILFFMDWFTQWNGYLSPPFFMVAFGSWILIVLAHRTWLQHRAKTDVHSQDDAASAHRETASEQATHSRLRIPDNSDWTPVPEMKQKRKRM